MKPLVKLQQTPWKTNSICKDVAVVKMLSNEEKIASGPNNFRAGAQQNGGVGEVDFCGIHSFVVASSLLPSHRNPTPNPGVQVASLTSPQHVLHPHSLSP